MNETLYEFIRRTLIWPEYRLTQGAKDFEQRLHTGEEKMRPIELSYVVNTRPVVIKEIILMIRGKMKQKELLEHFTFEMSELFALVATSLDDDEPGLWQQNSKDIDKKALDTLISWNLIYRSNQDCTDQVESLGLTLRGVRLAEWVRDHNDGWLKGTTLLKLKNH